MTKFDIPIVWAGGAAFVFSLAFVTWWYAVQLGREAPFAGWDPIVFDALVFSTFAFHHSWFARKGVKAAMARLVPPRLMRSVYVWTASALLVLVCLSWRPIGGSVYRIPFPWLMLNAALQLTGLLLIARAVRAIDALELAGIRPGGNAQALQTTGPYHLVRHPVYLGWALLVFGAAHMTGDRLVFAVISSAYLVIAVPWEEQALERDFGDAYRQYKRQVRWRIVPFVY